MSNNQIFYDVYERDHCSGKFNDSKKNKRILSLARRNKFYLNQVKNVLDPKGWQRFPKGFIITLATIKKRNDYKIIGFVIYSADFWVRERYSTTLEYWLVDKQFQGKGVGSQLFKIVTDFAITNTAPNLKVMFRENDENLKQIYAKYGFKYIPIYDKCLQKESDAGHTIWWQINQPVMYYGRVTEDEYIYYLV